MATDDLFFDEEEHQREEQAKAFAFSTEPLASRMRPNTLDDIVGQTQAIGRGTWLRKAIENDNVSSIILYGPAGTGKTSLARVIAKATSAAFVEVSAIGGSVADLRREIEEAKKRLAFQQKTILFVDEIHRFNKGQQDALLHAVENRTVILIGATTENPFFEVNSALLSRTRIVQLQKLDDGEVSALLDKALKSPKGLAGRFKLAPEARNAIISLSGGDGRSALTTLELASDMAFSPDKMEPIKISVEDVREAVPYRNVPYDKDKDQHYDIISAFIKSIRGSDPDAAIYWLARMIDGGEDPKFIARRLMISASEDVGLADPQAISVAHAAFKSAEVIGYPECRIPLAEATIYLALAPKSNSAYIAINAALDEVRNGPVRDVPSHLRDRNRPNSEIYGKYLYPHNYDAGWVRQQYLPDGLESGCFYTPKRFDWKGNSPLPG